MEHGDGDGDGDEGAIGEIRIKSTYVCMYVCMHV